MPSHCANFRDPHLDLGALKIDSGVRSVAQIIRRPPANFFAGRNSTRRINDKEDTDLPERIRHKRRRFTRINVQS